MRDELPPPNATFEGFIAERLLRDEIEDTTTPIYILELIRACSPVDLLCDVFLDDEDRLCGQFRLTPHT